MSKNCILYLVRTSENDLEMLNKSLALVRDNVLPNNPNVDILLFHEDSFTLLKSRVLDLPNIRFELVNFPEPPEGTPEIFPHPLPEQIAMGNLGFSVGYRNMCWFMSGGIFEQAIMQDYKYYLRLDTDSYILSPINYDIFDMMEKGNYKYGFIEEAIQLDNEKVVEGLWEFTGADVSGIEYRKMFYTNFEICSVDWFRNGFYYMFFRRIAASGNIHLKRWGDAPIRYIGVTMFMPEQYKKAVKGFLYAHGAEYDLR